jgi:CrcB protein
MASTVEIEPRGEAVIPERTDVHQHAGTRLSTLRSRPRPRSRFGEPRLLAAVFVGGAIGALLRAALTRYLPDAADGFPWTVFAINVGGAIVLAYVAIRLQERLPPSTYRRPLVGTGFCGALTTFSTLQVTVVRFGRDGHVALGAISLLASICAGIVAVALTAAVTRRTRLG